METTPMLSGSGLVLRPPIMADYAEWAQLRAQSRAHLCPYEPAWARDELSRPAFRRRVRHYQREMRDDRGAFFLVFDQEDDVLVGGITLSNVRRGVAQTGTIGYWTGVPFVSRGYMRKAVALLLEYAFEDFRLHRIEASCLPDNTASICVLERTGFRNEGLARHYLKINGVWQDHLLYAILCDDPRPKPERA